MGTTTGGSGSSGDPAAGVRWDRRIRLIRLGPAGDGGPRPLGPGPGNLLDHLARRRPEAVPGGPTRMPPTIDVDRPPGEEVSGGRGRAPKAHAQVRRRGSG